MNEQLPIADIPVGFFEYRTTFKEPIFAAWYEGKQSFVKEMYKVLVPWGVDLEKISWNATPKKLEGSSSYVCRAEPFCSCKYWNRRGDVRCKQRRLVASIGFGVAVSNCLRPPEGQSADRD
jgi:hypothetical protein